MYDLNFFSIPSKAKKRSVALPVGLFVVLLAAAAIGGWYLWQDRQMADIRRDINRMEAYLGAEPINSQLAELHMLKQKSQLLQSYQTTFAQIDETLGSARTVDTTLLEDISGTLPTGVTFESLSINGLQVSIEGTATSSLAAAELLHNLKQSGRFTQVHLGELTVETQEAVEEVLQHFTIQAVGKEVTAP